MAWHIFWVPTGTKQYIKEDDRPHTMGNNVQAVFFGIIPLQSRYRLFLQCIGDFGATVAANVKSAITGELQELLFTKW